MRRDVESVPVTSRMPRYVVERAEVVAALEGVSRSRFIARATDRVAQERLAKIRSRSGGDALSDA